MNEHVFPIQKWWFSIIATWVFRVVFIVFFTQNVLLLRLSWFFRINNDPTTKSRWWFQLCFYLHLYLGRCSNLTNIFQMGGKKPPTRTSFVFTGRGLAMLPPFVWGGEPWQKSRLMAWTILPEPPRWLAARRWGTSVFQGEMSNVKKMGGTRDPGCLGYTYRGWTPNPRFFWGGLFHKPWNKDFYKTSSFSMECHDCGFIITAQVGAFFFWGGN